MKTVFPSPGPASTTISPPLLRACSATSTAPDSSFARLENCLRSASWWTSCSVASDDASSSSCDAENKEVFDCYLVLFILSKQKKSNTFSLVV